MKKFSIAIDGPSGAGKSTLAKAVAESLNYLYVDTGAIYRTIAYYLYSHHIDCKDEETIAKSLPHIKVNLRYDEDGLQRMILNGTDVTQEIRLPEISLWTSIVSSYPSVRDFLLDMQRHLAETNDVIMDGRDIGTVVLPNADVKIYLTASPEARANRRCKELAERGTPESYEKILAEIWERDYNDSHRAMAPLKQAKDAILVDTTQLDFQASKQEILDIIRKKQYK